MDNDYSPDVKVGTASMFVAAWSKMKTSPMAALSYLYLAALFGVSIILIVLTHTTFERYDVADAQKALLIPSIVASFVASYDAQTFASCRSRCRSVHSWIHFAQPYPSFGHVLN
jgi:hypothetical protein